MVEEASTSGRQEAMLGVSDRFSDFLGQRARPYMTSVLKAGPVPRHIAFIMDGNRRYASRRKKISTAGHQFGYYKVNQRGSLWPLQGISM